MAAKRFKVATDEGVQYGPWVVETDDLSDALNELFDSIAHGQKVTFKAKAKK